MSLATMIDRPTNRVVDRFESRTKGGEAGASRVVRVSGLTSRDIEDELLVRLARRGYDWTGALGKRRRGP